MGFTGSTCTALPRDTHAPQLPPRFEEHLGRAVLGRLLRCRGPVRAVELTQRVAIHGGAEVCEAQ
jgi:hypothetical protein